MASVDAARQPTGPAPAIKGSWLAPLRSPPLDSGARRAQQERLPGAATSLTGGDSVLQLAPERGFMKTVLLFHNALCMHTGIRVKGL